MTLNNEELKRRLREDLTNRGLRYALETLGDEYVNKRSLSEEKYLELLRWLVEEFFQRKRIDSWCDNDIEGIDRILKAGNLPYDLRLEVFRKLREIYSTARDAVGNIVGALKPGTPASVVVKGLIVLIENFENFAEMKKPEVLRFPSIVPPEPRPDDKVLNEVIGVVEKSKQVILMGPPGSGKTHLAMWVAHEMTKDGRGYWVLVQFHRSYRYEDFIERIVLKPPGELRGVAVEVAVEPQLFVRLCRYAQQNKEKNIVLVIDEINRADVASVFGELMYALEYRGYPVRLAYSEEELAVPENLYIIATANDIERGTFDIGVALRRRFEVIRVDTDDSKLRELLQSQGAPDDVVNLAIEIFNGVNKLFEKLIDRKGVGHLFFRDVRDKNGLAHVWRYRIKPLIEAYLLAPGSLGQEAQDLIKRVESELKQLSMV